MLNRKELRIGNIISVATDEDENPIPCKVLELFTNECRWTTALKGPIFGDGNDTSYDYIEGIPLTSEWLENAGFNRRDNFAYDFGKLSIVLKGDHGYRDGRTYYNSWAILESQPKYVHSLQNILHAIEGIELNIK